MKQLYIDAAWTADPQNGFHSPTVFDRVTPVMTIAKKCSDQCCASTRNAAKAVLYSLSTEKSPWPE